MRTLKYIPEMNDYTGRLEATILFLQLNYWFVHMKYKPFYKYLCPNSLATPGDSLIEELGISVHVLKQAKKQISSELKKDRSYALHEHQLILYWREYPNKTFYLPNYVAMFLIEKDSKVFSRHFPHYRKWKENVMKGNIQLSDITFLPSLRSMTPLSYIQEMKQEKKAKDKTEEETKDETEVLSSSISFLNDSDELKTIKTLWKNYLRKEKGEDYTEKEELIIIESIEKYGTAFVLREIKNAEDRQWRNFIFPNTPTIYKKFLLENKNNISHDSQQSNYNDEDIFGENA